MSVTQLDWRLFAACRNEDPALFFAAEDEKPRAQKSREARAKAVCASCTVTAACLAYRLQGSRQYDDGIWGGLDGPERAAMRREMKQREEEAA